MTQTRSLCLNLHIGQAKTGTTTLQQALFRKHPEIRYFGQFVPSSVRMHCESEEIFQLLNPLLWDTKSTLNLSGARNLLHRNLLNHNLDSNNTAAKCLVASWEGLIARSVETNIEMIRRIKTVFGECRILVTLRNPLKRLPSEYLENLKGHFIKGAHTWIGRLPYIDFEQWLQKAMDIRHLPILLSYSQIIRSAVDELGKDRVGVFLFEDLVNAPADYIARICNFIQVDPQVGLKLMKDQHLHPSRTQGEIDFLQKLNRSPARRFFLKVAGWKYRKKIFAQQGNNVRVEAVELPESWRRKVFNATYQGNRWLSETFDLPLAKYGYPMEPLVPSRTTASQS